MKPINDLRDWAEEDDEREQSENTDDDDDARWTYEQDEAQRMNKEY